MPEDFNRIHRSVRELRDSRGEQLDTSSSTQRRALLPLQAIANECERSGHGFGLLPDDDPRRFRLTVDGVPMNFGMLDLIDF